MNIFYCENLKKNTVLLNAEESKHCTQVMRKKTGDLVHLFDGKGTKAVGEINHIDKKQVQISISEREVVPEDNYRLHIAVAPTKQINKIEWFVEKAIEFGVHEITFLQTKRTERSRLNMERMRRIVLAAAKQSLSAYLPKLNDLTSLGVLIKKDNLPETRLIATLHDNATVVNFNELKDGIALIGPEGGFTEQEVELAISKDFQPVSLGHKRLRTETAALFFASAMYEKELHK